MIDHATWTNRYGSDPEIIGRAIEIERQPWTVVGVLDAAGWFPSPGTAILTALRPTPEERTERGLRNLFVLARIAPDASIDTVQTELALISERLTAAYPESDSARWVRTYQRPLPRCESRRERVRVARASARGCCRVHR